MNERIRELAVQAKEYARSHVADCRRFGYYMEYNEYELRFEQKFAELIVAECAKACEKNSYLALNGWQRAKQIREHFGVES
jgi:hypothetical protein